MERIVKNGTVVTTGGLFAADVGIAGGKVVALGQGLDGTGEIIDATGCYVMPGGIDVHTHVDGAGFGVKSADDFGTATMAAACGGTTTIIDFCEQARGQSLADAIATWDAKARGKAAIDYGYHMILVDLGPDQLAELEGLPAKGITSFKVFMAYRGMLMVDDVTLLNALDVAKRTGALVMVHAENGDAADYLRDKLIAEGKTAPRYHGLSRPPRVEAEATARAIALAEIVGAPIYVVHLSCREALDQLLDAKRRGVEALAETCTQYLYLTEDDLARPGFEGAKYVFTPLPRTVADQEALWQALRHGVLETVSSDHCSWLLDGHKDLGKDDFRKIPNGAPGIEERLMMLYQGVRAGRISLTQFVDLAATRPAKVFGLFPEKGSIGIGAYADLVLWDPEARGVIRKAELHSAVDYSSYEGREVVGRPRTTLLRGEVIVRDGVYVGSKGQGRFLRRHPYVPLSGQVEGGRR